MQLLLESLKYHKLNFPFNYIIRFCHNLHLIVDSTSADITRFTKSENIDISRSVAMIAMIYLSTFIGNERN